MTAKDFKYNGWQPGERSITEWCADNEMENIALAAGFVHVERLKNYNIITEKKMIVEGLGKHKKSVDIAIGDGKGNYLISLECQIGQLDQNHAFRSVHYAKTLNAINIILCQGNKHPLNREPIDNNPKVITIIVEYSIVDNKFKFRCDNPLKGFIVPLIESKQKNRIKDEVRRKTLFPLENLLEMNLPEENGSANHPIFLDRKNDSNFKEGGLILNEKNNKIKKEHSRFLGVSKRGKKSRAYIYLPIEYRDLESSRVSQKHGNGVIDLLISEDEEECALIAQDAHAYVEKYGWDGFLEKLEECGINRWNYTGSWQI